MIHFGLPYSFESYFQEIGRAGRSEGLAHCYLLFHPSEFCLAYQEGQRSESWKHWWGFLCYGLIDWLVIIVDINDAALWTGGLVTASLILYYPNWRRDISVFKSQQRLQRASGRLRETTTPQEDTACSLRLWTKALAAGQYQRMDTELDSIFLIWAWVSCYLASDITLYQKAHAQMKKGLGMLVTKMLIPSWLIPLFLIWFGDTQGPLKHCPKALL